MPLVELLKIFLRAAERNSRFVRLYFLEKKFLREVLPVRKKWLVVTGAVVLTLALAAGAFAANPIKLIVNGQEIKPDVPPQIINGRTMVPIRWVAEALGADVQWDEQQRIVRVDFGELPQSIQEKWQYPKPDGGELTLGYLGRQAGFLLPVVATLNDFLAKQQIDSLYSGQGTANQTVLVRYEILDSGRTDGGMNYSDAGAYELTCRLYYSEIQPEEGYPPYIIRAYEQKGPGGRLGGSHENLKVVRSWYEDVMFVVRPKGDIADVQRDDAKGRTTWVKGRQGWYVDESATQVLKKGELKQMPILFDYPLPPAGYNYTLMKQQ
jgi:hypothetical protein